MNEKLVAVPWLKQTLIAARECRKNAFIDMKSETYSTSSQYHGSFLPLKMKSTICTKEDEKGGGKIRNVLMFKQF